MSIRLAVRSSGSPSGFAVRQNHDGQSNMIGALIRQELCTPIIIIALFSTLNNFLQMA